VPTLGSAQLVPKSLQFLIFSGLQPGSSSSTYYYDDDGKSKEFEDGAFAMTPVKVELSSDQSKLTVTVGTFTGNGFPDLPSQRNYRLSILSVLPPNKVQVSGKDLSQCDKIDQDCWSYDGTQLSVEVHLVTPRSLNQAFSAVIFFTQQQQGSIYTTAGPSNGFVRKTQLLQKAKDLLDNNWGTYTPDDYPTLCRAAVIARNVTMQEIPDLLNSFPQMYQTAIQEVDRLANDPLKFQTLALLRSA